jgi:Fic family protein
LQLLKLWIFMDIIMDYLSQIVITPELLQSIAEIDEFKGQWQALSNLAPERLSALRRIATIESVGSSTRIEGVKLTDIEIEKLLSGLDVRSFRSRDEEEVAGYADLMELVFESYADIDFKENTIKQLHGVLLKYSAKDQRHRGNYKTLSNNMEAFDSEGCSMGIIFETATPFDTPRLMQELVEETKQALAEHTHHRLLVIGEFVVRFLAIHPFQDGNGRISRALTTLLLLREGYNYVPYSSLERIVEESKDEYYKALRRAQKTMGHENSKFIEWLLFFVKILHKQKEILNRKVAQEKIMSPISPLSEKVMKIVREHGRITVFQAVSITKANRNTVKLHIKQLVNAGLLVKRGKGRGTWYEQSMNHG